MKLFHRGTIFFFFIVLCCGMGGTEKACRKCADRKCRSPLSLGCPKYYEQDGCGCCSQCVVECDKLDCRQASCPATAEELGCPDSYEIDPCGCCERCLGGVGEKCGGSVGTCKRELTCRPYRSTQKFCTSRRRRRIFPFNVNH